MRLNRKSSLLLAFTIILVFFTIARLTAPSQTPVARVEPDVEKNDSNGAVPENTLASQFELTNFQRSETRNGRKVWEVTADNGKYFPDQEITRLKNVHVVSLRHPDSKLEISADSADVTLNGTSLSSATLHDNVEAVLREEVVVKTSTAFYKYAENHIEIPGFVTITGPFYTSQGNQMSVETEEQVIVLEGNVKTVIQPVPKKNEKGAPQ